MPPRASKTDIAEPALAAAGQARIEWADAEMPVLRQIRARFEAERPLEGIVVGACLHVTAETANLVRTLVAGGAEVALCASNPLSTQDDTAAALAIHHGAEVHARHGEDLAAYRRHIEAVCDRRPRITMDDGADLVAELHEHRPDQAAELIGGTEETTFGVIRLRALHASGALRCPVIAVNEADTMRLFDNRHGTGQSTIDGILRATSLLLAGRRVVVIGYGLCGRGVAERAKGAGAQVIVCEVDPLRAVEAAMDGYAVMPALEAARQGDVFISVTGNRDAITRKHFEVMRDGAIVCNAGHFDVEINKDDLAALTSEKREVRPFVEEHLLEDGRRINLLAEGRLVNLAAGEGHPASVMDMSFANQALAVEHLALNAGALEPGVHAVPEAIDDEIARLKLEAMGVRIDKLSRAQRRYREALDRG